MRANVPILLCRITILLAVPVKRLGNFADADVVLQR